MAVVTPPQITPPPLKPQRGDKATFRERVDDFITWMIAVVAQFAALAQNVFNNAQDAAGSAGAANTSAGNANQSKNDANQAKLDAQQARYDAGQFAVLAQDARDVALGAAAALRGTSASALTIGVGSKSLTTEAGRQFAPGVTLKLIVSTNGEAWMTGRVTSYNSATGALVVNVTAVAAGYAGQGANSWNVYVAGEVGPTGPMGGLSGGNLTGALNEKRTAAVPVSDYPDIWSGAGNSMYLTGSGDVLGFANAPQIGARRTLLALGSPRLVFSPTLVVFGGTRTFSPGDFIDVWAEEVNIFHVTVRKRDGKAVVGSRLVVEVIAASQMWTVKATEFEVEMCGGGQSGRGSSHAGGWCGAYAKKNFTGATIGATASITVGTGGAATTNATRSDGGNSSFALSGFTTITCEGGKDTGAAASGGDININGVPGDAPGVCDVSLYGNNFVAIYRSGSGADGQMGNGAPCTTNTSAAVNGSGYGSGGAGTHGRSDINGSYIPVLLGSAGRPGVCIIRYYV